MNSKNRQDAYINDSAPTAHHANKKFMTNKFRNNAYRENYERRTDKKENALYGKNEIYRHTNEANVAEIALIEPANSQRSHTLLSSTPRNNSNCGVNKINKLTNEELENMHIQHYLPRQVNELDHKKRKIAVAVTNSGYLMTPRSEHNNNRNTTSVNEVKEMLQQLVNISNNLSTYIQTKEGSSSSMERSININQSNKRRNEKMNIQLPASEREFAEVITPRRQITQLNAMEIERIVRRVETHFSQKIKELEIRNAKLCKELMKSKKMESANYERSRYEHAKSNASLLEENVEEYEEPSEIVNDQCNLTNEVSNPVFQHKSHGNYSIDTNVSKDLANFYIDNNNGDQGQTADFANGINSNKSDVATLHFEKAFSKLYRELQYERHQRLIVEEQTQKLNEEHMKIISVLERRLRKQEEQIQMLSNNSANHVVIHNKCDVGIVEQGQELNCNCNDNNNTNNTNNSNLLFESKSVKVISKERNMHLNTEEGCSEGNNNDSNHYNSNNMNKELNDATGDNVVETELSNTHMKTNKLMASNDKEAQKSEETKSNTNLESKVKNIGSDDEHEATNIITNSDLGVKENRVNSTRISNTGNYVNFTFDEIDGPVLVDKVLTESRSTTELPTHMNEMQNIDNSTKEQGNIRAKLYEHQHNEYNGDKFVPHKVHIDGLTSNQLTGVKIEHDEVDSIEEFLANITKELESIHTNFEPRSSHEENLYERESKSHRKVEIKRETIS